MQKSDHHTLIEFHPNRWECAICGMDEYECVAVICGAEPVTVYARTKARKKARDESLKRTATDMDDFLGRIFK